MRGVYVACRDAVGVWDGKCFVVCVVLFLFAGVVYCWSNYVYNVSIRHSCEGRLTLCPHYRGRCIISGLFVNDWWTNFSVKYDVSSGLHNGNYTVAIATNIVALATKTSLAIAKLRLDFTQVAHHLQTEYATKSFFPISSPHSFTSPYYFWPAEAARENTTRLVNLTSPTTRWNFQ